MKIDRLTILGTLLFGFNGFVRADWEETFSETTHPFLSAHCIHCHDEESKKGGLNLDALSKDLADPEAVRPWVLVFDKVTEGEMPPPKKKTKKPDPKQRETFLASLSDALEVADRKRSAERGRAVLRRLNRLEYEHTLRDLLEAPWLQIKGMLPEDGEAHRFNKVGEALDVSHVQMAQYLQAADYALREVIAPQVKKPDASTQRFYAREQRKYAGKMRYNQFNRSPERATFPLLDHQADLPVLKGKAPMTVGPSDPEKRARESFGVVASAYEPIEPRFDSFEAPLPGRYRLRFNGYTFWAEPESEERWWKPSREKIAKGRRDEPVSIYAHQDPGLLRKLGGFDLTPDPTAPELDVWLVSGESIRPDPARLFRSRPWPWHNPLATREGQPGVAFKWLEVEGPLFDQWPSAGHRLLFGNLPLRDLSDGSGVDVLSEDQEQDAERLLRRFMNRAYRQPVRDADVNRFLALTLTALKAGGSFKDAMIVGYSAVLCSPGFIYLDEKPGKLRSDALAARLSYFLWNSEPDPALRERVSNGELKKPSDWRTQADRMLDDPRARRFVDAFSDYWLDLRRVNDTAPDAALYPDYYLDDLLVESAVEETQLFIADLIRNNRPSRNLVSSDYAMLNERLAAHYGIPNVEGIEVRRVSLPADSPRGGLLTQASVLKVTANGTTTSPVLRGAWVMERILGRKPPPPPPSVPAIEPDTRGAKTIREQLDKHRVEKSCKACHAKIDPAGFALENFDVLGGWRERYRGLDEAIKTTLKGYGKNGQPFEFHLAQAVDASGVLPGGGAFENIREFKTRLLEDERQIARNLVRQLVIYSTGAPIRFGDRSEIERILDRTKDSGYGVRSILLEIVASELFSSK